MASAYPGGEIRGPAPGAKHDPKAPHWHIGPSGFHRAHQGRGVGTVLLGVSSPRSKNRARRHCSKTDVDRTLCSTSVSAST